MPKTEESAKAHWLTYKAGGKNREDQTITFVVAITPDIAVYFIEGEESFVYEVALGKFPKRFRSDCGLQSTCV